MKPRVLYVTSRFPYPPDRGDRLHAFHTIRVLASDFEVTVACFTESPEEIAAGKEWFAERGARVLAVPLGRVGRLARLALALPGGRPLQVAYYDEPAMRRALSDLTRREPPFDATICHLIRTAPFAEVARARVRVISLCDSLSLGLRRRLSHAPWLERPSIRMEAGRVARYEARILDRFDEGWVVSDVDRRAFGAGAAKIRVLPNGVDERLFEGPIPEDPPSVVGFLGHLGVPHNVDAAVFLARRILPVLRDRGIEARVRLIGPEPAPAVRALSALPGVEMTGFAPDLRVALQGLRVMCAPLRFSAGIQNKLLEAMAAGVPVVTSPAAAEALGGEAARWIGTATTPDGYADAIAAAWVRSAEARERLSEGRVWIRSHFRWEAYGERLKQLLEG